MRTIPEILNDAAKSNALVDAVCRLIDDEVGAKKGLGGMAIKAGFKLVQGVKPGFVKEVVQRLLPEFAEVLEPLRQEAQEEGRGVAPFFASNANSVADKLLAVTDARATKVDNAAIKGAYNKLRGSAQKNVASAVPGLGKIVDEFTS